MKMNLQFTIPVIPRSKKNSSQIAKSKKTGRYFIVPSQQFKSFEKDCKKYIAPFIQEEPISFPVNIRYRFYMPTNRAVDLTNLIEAIDDVLVKFKVLADDNFRIVAGHDGSRVYVDKDNPRIEICIEEIEE